MDPVTDVVEAPSSVRRPVSSPESVISWRRSVATLPDSPVAPPGRAMVPALVESVRMAAVTARSGWRCTRPAASSGAHW
jgi:hypothetical protein